MPDQKTMRTRCLGGFSVMWVTKLLISPVKKGFFAQKPPNLARIWHFWPLLAHSVPCWWVGWWLWRAGCISQDTYLLYLFVMIFPLAPVWCNQDQRSPGVTDWPRHDTDSFKMKRFCLETKIVNMESHKIKRALELSKFPSPLDRIVSM